MSAHVEERRPDVAAAEVPERVAWIALSAVEGVGEVTFARLVAACGGAARVLALARDGRLADHLDASQRHRVRHGVFDAIADAAREPERLARRLDALGLWAVTPLDRGYPGRLEVLDPPPPCLYGAGDAALLQAGRTVAVVGTRRPTAAGRLLAARVAARLAEAGVVVVSGLAVGIDGAAHAATVEGGAPTIAVIGGGHLHAVPRVHRRLVERILETGGAVVSELPPDVAPSTGTFPRRNRIIAALSDATIVIEAPHRSGALITARLALEQGRPVLAAPGRPGDPTTAGCLALLRETPARPLVGLDEMLADLPHGGPGLADVGAAARLSAAEALALLGPAERAVAERLRAGPVTVDGLVTATRLAPPVVAAAVTLLQLRGWTRATGSLHLPAGPLLT